MHLRDMKATNSWLSVSHVFWFTGSFTATISGGQREIAQWAWACDLPIGNLNPGTPRTTRSNSWALFQDWCLSTAVWPKLPSSTSPPPKKSIMFFFRNYSKTECCAGRIAHVVECVSCMWRTFSTIPDSSGCGPDGHQWLPSGSRASEHYQGAVYQKYKINEKETRWAVYSILDFK